MLSYTPEGGCPEYGGRGRICRLPAWLTGDSSRVLLLDQCTNGPSVQGFGQARSGITFEGGGATLYVAKPPAGVTEPPPRAGVLRAEPGRGGQAGTCSPGALGWVFLSLSHA